MTDKTYDDARAEKAVEVEQAFNDADNLTALFKAFGDVVRLKGGHVIEEVDPTSRDPD